VDCVIIGPLDWDFCTGTVLSLLDLLVHVTSLNGVLAASEAAMVESLFWVIDLQAHA